MPNFDTPEPISVTLELGVGDVRIIASDRTDTVVEVRPSDESDESDVKAAAAGPRRLRRRHAAGHGPEGARFRLLPQDQVGRRVHRTAQRLAGVRRAAGRATSAAPAGSGSAGSRPPPGTSGSSGPARCAWTPAAGHVTVDGVAGDAEISTGSGKVQHRRDRRHRGGQELQRRHRRSARSPATLRVRAANGDISVDRAGAGVDAKTANGSIRLGEVARGSVDARHRRGRPGDRHRRGHRRLARREHRVRAGAQPLDERHPARRRPTRPSRCARAPPTATSPSAAPDPLLDPEKGNHDHDAIPAGDRGDRAAQVVRRPGRARRHRPARRRRARSSRCSAPTAPARPPPSRSCPR